MNMTIFFIIYNLILFLVACLWGIDLTLKRHAHSVECALSFLAAILHVLVLSSLLSGYYYADPRIINTILLIFWIGVVGFHVFGLYHHHQTRLKLSPNHRQ